MFLPVPDIHVSKQALEVERLVSLASHKCSSRSSVTSCGSCISCYLVGALVVAFLMWPARACSCAAYVTYSMSCSCAYGLCWVGLLRLHYLSFCAFIAHFALILVKVLCAGWLRTSRSAAISAAWAVDSSTANYGQLMLLIRVLQNIL